MFCANPMIFCCIQSSDAVFMRVFMIIFIFLKLDEIRKNVVADG